LLGDLGREPLDETLGRIPEGVRNVLEYRIGQLPADVVEALSIAAVIGLEFNVWLLARVLQREPALLFEQLQTAVGDSVLTEGSGHRRLRFAHSLVRDTLLDLLGPPLAAPRSCPTGTARRLSTSRRWRSSRERAHQPRSESS
jgi:hypothetical protein